MTYQERLRGIREDRDLTQKQIAELLGVTQTTYSGYKLGKYALPIDCLMKLCRYYDISADEFLGLNKRR